LNVVFKLLVCSSHAACHSKDVQWYHGGSGHDIFGSRESKIPGTWKKKKVLATPPRIKDIEFNEDDTKQSFIDKGFIEVKLGVAPFRTQSLKNKIQAKRKQYGLRHQVTRTIHAAMGDTLISIAMEISLNDPQFRLWDKGKLVVILSRTKRISKILLPR